MKRLFLILTVGFLFQIGFSQERLELFSEAPNFTGIDQYGEKIVLKEMLKEGSVVVVFYRGEWCPHCNRHMHNLQDSLEMINKFGARVVAVTPEKVSNIAKTTEKSGAEFSIVYDKGHKIMDDYKVTFTLGVAKHLMYGIAGINVNEASGNDDRALPVPATYIIEKNGRIIGAHFNEDYTVRMPVSEVVRIFEIREKILSGKKNIYR